jgi:hypothetical protein
MVGEAGKRSPSEQGRAVARLHAAVMALPSL